MKIGLYIDVLKAQEKTGIGRYVEGLIKSLVKLENDSQYILYYQEPLFDSLSIDIDIQSPKIKLRPIKFPSQWFDKRPRLWWDYYLPFIAQLDRIDIFHGPNHFIPSRGNFKKVVTIHDIAYFFMNVHGSGMDRILKNWTLKSMKAADIVIGVSDSTINDCIKEGLDSNKAVKIYQGFESSFEHLRLSDDEVALEIENLKLPAKCILFLGTIQPRKNLSCLINSFASIFESIPHTLVLAGGPGSSQSEVENLVTKHNLNTRVVFTGYISDSQRAALYQHSELFVYPSKYEGFGLVLLESMSFGLPVIACRNSALPEVVNDAGILVESDNIQALAESMYNVLTDDTFRQSLIARGLKRCTIFTWKQCAKLTSDVYKNLVS
jgi:glycosyltransferase involved in cell wall biosynthesis